MATFVSLKYAYAYSTLRSSSLTDNLHRVPFHPILSLLVFIILHGASILKTILANYALTKAMGETRLSFKRRCTTRRRLRLASLHSGPTFLAYREQYRTFSLPPPCDGYTFTGQLAWGIPTLARQLPSQHHRVAPCVVQYRLPLDLHPHRHHGCTSSYCSIAFLRVRGADAQ